MPIAPDSFLYDHDRSTGVATLMLNRPDKLNAITFEVYDELGKVFRALDTEPDVRAIVITGRGRAFCSGGDINDIIGPLLDRELDELHRFTTMTCEVIKAMRSCRRPIVAALNGTTAGAGAVIATACDIRVAAESARIGFVFAKVGLSGADMGSCWLLPRIVGLGRASELLYTGELIDATEAHRIGLYNHVVADDRVLEVALNLAEKLARGPSYAHGITKEHLDLEADMTLADALDLEAAVQAGCMRNPDFRNAYEAFVERREPEFNRRPDVGVPEEPTRLEDSNPAADE